MGRIKLKSLGKASVVRKFSVLFTLMSFFPFMVLFALFFYFKTRGMMKLDLNLLFWVIVLVGLSALIGFFGMRQSLMSLVKVSEGVKQVIEGNVPAKIDVKTAGDNEVAQIARAFNEVVQKLEVNIRELEKSKATLHNVLSKVAGGVSSAENINKFLDLILETTVNALGGRGGLLLVTADDKDELIVKSSFGAASSFYSRNQHIPIGTEAFGWVVKQGKPLLIPRLHKAAAAKPGDASSVIEPPLICAPLAFQGKPLGVIAVSGKNRDINFEEDELLVLSDLGCQIALAIENAKLHSDVQETFLETITALALAVEARDPYSRGHSERVSKYAAMIAEKMGLDKEKIRELKDAARLHDVGKIGISDDILRKPEALTEYEMEIMRQHPIIGEGIIVPLHGFSHLRDPIRHHHEWVNGTGYPDHLKGDEISLAAKILAVADSFDAMTTDRPYRKGLDFAFGKQELSRYKGIRYDANVVDTFVSCI